MKEAEGGKKSVVGADAATGCLMQGAALREGLRFPSCSQSLLEATDGMGHVGPQK
jgi:hypothetical protein